MTISRAELLRVAALAELGVAEQDVDGLARDIGSIVDYVSLLSQLPSDDDLPPFLPGPQQGRLRPDAIDPIPLTRSPSDMAPEFVDGFYVVPKLEAMEEE